MLRISKPTDSCQESSVDGPLNPYQNDSGIISFDLKWKTGERGNLGDLNGMQLARKPYRMHGNAY